ncbi:MAG: MarR family transcriptional regulator [Methanospirillum sp.]
MTVESARERAADQVVAVLPLFHRAIFRPIGAQNGRVAMEFRVLKLLSEYGELRMTEISRCLFVSKPYMTAIVDALIAAGSVERRPDPADRRAVRIAVTADGERRLREGVAYVRQILLGRLTVLDETEIVLLSESLENLSRILARLGTDQEQAS